MAHDVARRGARLRAPARTVLAVARRVEPQAADDDEGVAGVRVDGDPRALAGLPEALELARVHRLREQAAAVQRVADGSGAVVARVLPAAVAAAVLVRLVGDGVGRRDGILDLLRRAVGRDRGAPVWREHGLRAVVAAGVVGGAAGSVGRGAGGRVVAARLAVVRGVVERTGVRGLQLAVHAAVLAALPALDARRGARAVDAVGLGPDADGGQRLLRGADVTALRPDLQRAVAELCLRGGGDDEARKHSKSGARTSAAPDPLPEHGVVLSSVVASGVSCRARAERGALGLLGLSPRYY